LTYFYVSLIKLIHPSFPSIMKTIIHITIVLLTITSIGRAQDKLPLQVEILLKKLTEWETNEKATFDKNVQAKRSLVVVALKAQLKKTTQAGDLKTANLIQAKIDELGVTGSKTAGLGDKPMSKSAAKKATEEKFVEMEWRDISGLYQFMKRGKMIKTFVSGGLKGKSEEFEWEAIDENIVDSVSKNGAVIHLTLTSDNAGLVKVFHSTGKVVLDGKFTLVPIPKK